LARVFRPKKTTGTIKVFAFIAVAVVVVCLVYWGLGSLSTNQSDRERQIAEDAIVKASVQCYALESQFPTGLAYLEENYGLSLDHDKYVYHYRSIGSNMMPEIKVFPKTGGGA
jgi:hypothetical protein